LNAQIQSRAIARKLNSDERERKPDRGKRRGIRTLSAALRLCSSPFVNDAPAAPQCTPAASSSRKALPWASFTQGTMPPGSLGNSSSIEAAPTKPVSRMADRYSLNGVLPRPGGRSP
jgi:hypothetical protein